MIHVRRLSFAAGLLLAGVIASAQNNCAPTAGTATLVPAGAFTQVVPHITTGGGFVTKFTIVNLSSTANTIVFNNITQSGTLIDSTTCTLAANGTVRIATPEAGRFPIPASTETHWALVGSTQPAGVNLFFEFMQSPGGAVVNTVGFNDTAPRTSFTFPVELAGGTQFHTLGLAVANVSNASNTVTVSLFDVTGNKVASAPLSAAPLPAYGQTAVNLQTVLAAFPIINTNFIGSVVISGTGPISTVGVGDDVGPFFSEAGMFVAPSAPNLSATVTMTSADLPGNGLCTQKSVAVSGATTAMTAAVSPVGDPIANGLVDVLWSAWVPAANQVTVRFCKFSKAVATVTSPQVFNIRLLASSVAAAAGTVTIPAGSQIAEASCVSQRSAVAGAMPASTIVLSPAGDPAAAGLEGVQWVGYSDSIGSVTSELCRASAGNVVTTAALDFNVAVLN